MSVQRLSSLSMPLRTASLVKFSGEARGIRRGGAIAEFWANRSLSPQVFVHGLVLAANVVGPSMARTTNGR
jgi:hypothetical protein